MNRNKLFLVIGVIAVLIILISVKSMVKPADNKTAAMQKSDLEVQYMELKNAGIPAMIIFSYDGDC